MIMYQKQLYMQLLFSISLIDEIYRFEPWSAKHGVSRPPWLAAIAVHVLAYNLIRTLMQKLVVILNAFLYRLVSRV